MSNIRKTRPRKPFLRPDSESSGWRGQLQRLEENLQDLVNGQGKVRRPKGNIAGVCAGLGEYFGINPTWLRIGFMAGTLLSGGLALLLYAALAIVIPRRYGPQQLSGESAGEAAYPWEEAFEEEPAFVELELCENCDTALKPQARFCHNCGQEVEGGMRE
jgi:phage shock protein PspC (stress-responsive transcriptional regulator)